MIITGNMEARERSSIEVGECMFVLKERDFVQERFQSFLKNMCLKDNQYLTKWANWGRVRGRREQQTAEHFRKQRRPQMVRAGK